MGQVLHPNAITTHATRKAIQEAPAKVSTYALAKRYRLNYRTVQKWRQRNSVEDLQSGPKEPRSKSLSKVEEAACLFFRCATQLPLDDCLNVLEEAIPHLKRSNLHRLYQNYEISSFPKEENQTPETKTFKEYPIGYFHVDIVQVNTEEGRLYMFVSIDRVSKFAYVELHDKSTRGIAAQFLKTVIEKVPYSIHTVLTDNGSQFTSPRKPKVSAIENESLNHKINKGVNSNAFDAVCLKNNIEHRVTLPYHPWINGQEERINRTINEATVKKHYYKTHEKLKDHLQSFIDAYNFEKRLKALKGSTVFDYMNKCWNEEPDKFKTNPMHLFEGLYD